MVCLAVVGRYSVQPRCAELPRPRRVATPCSAIVCLLSLYIYVYGITLLDLL